MWGRPRKNFIKVRKNYAKYLEELEKEMRKMRRDFPIIQIENKGAARSLGKLAKKTNAFLISKHTNTGETFLIPSSRRRIKKIDETDKWVWFELF